MSMKEFHAALKIAKTIQNHPELQEDAAVKVTESEDDTAMEVVDATDAEKVVDVTDAEKYGTDTELQD